MVRQPAGLVTAAQPELAELSQPELALALAGARLPQLLSSPQPRGAVPAAVGLPPSVPQRQPAP